MNKWPTSLSFSWPYCEIKTKFKKVRLLSKRTWDVNLFKKKRKWKYYIPVPVPPSDSSELSINVCLPWTSEERTKKAIIGRTESFFFVSNSIYFSWRGFSCHWIIDKSNDLSISGTASTRLVPDGHHLEEGRKGGLEQLETDYDSRAKRDWLAWGNMELQSV